MPLITANETLQKPNRQVTILCQIAHMHSSRFRIETYEPGYEAARRELIEILQDI